MNILNRIVIVQECDATEVEKNYYSRGHKKIFFSRLVFIFHGIVVPKSPFRGQGLLKSLSISISHSVYTDKKK
jgi:hypothetical protein